jgi:hypothetical protein
MPVTTHTDLRPWPQALNLNAIDPTVDARFSYNLFELLHAAQSAHLLAHMQAFRTPDQMLWVGLQVEGGDVVARQLHDVLSDGEDAQVYTLPAFACEVVSDFWNDYAVQGRNVLIGDVRPAGGTTSPHGLRHNRTRRRPQLWA